MLNIKPTTVEVGRNEEPGTVGFATPTAFNANELRNYAEDEDVLNQIRQLTPLIDETRTNRLNLHEEWMSIIRMWALQHDSNRRYMGRSNAYIPVYGRVRKTKVTSLSRGLFPSDDYMDVVSREDGDPERARPVKQYMQWELETNARIKMNIKPFLGQFADFGCSVLKFWYQTEIRQQGRLEMRRRLLSAPEAAPSFARIAAYDGLCVRPISMFSWYMYPITAANINEATLVFEDCEVSRATIQEMGLKKVWKNVEAALSAQTPPEDDTHRTDIIDTLGKLATPTSMRDQTDLGDVRVLTEAWCYLKLPRDAYQDDEDPRLPIPARVLLARGTPLRVTRNPFWHQRPPYLYVANNTAPGFAYGIGDGRSVRHLQYLTNDFANQTNDVGQYTLNPIGKRNPSLMVGPMRPLSPGVVYDMLSPDAFTFERPPTELIGAGLQMLNTYITMTQDFGGAPPQLQGAQSGGNAKTATGMQILQRNALTPLQDEVEDLQDAIMIPLLQLGFINAQQYRRDEVMTAVAGAAMKISPDQLAGDYEFRWLAASQAVNAQQRAQNLMGFIQACLPLMQPLAMQGKVMDFSVLLRKIWSDGLGLRNFDQFLVQQPMMPGMPGAGPPGMGPPQAPGGDENVRSALEQSQNGPSGDMVPGEGEDFADIRRAADEQAAMLGRGGGMQ